jgi:hypothetical protein
MGHHPSHKGLFMYDVIDRGKQAGVGIQLVPTHIQAKKGDFCQRNCEKLVMYLLFCILLSMMFFLWKGGEVVNQIRILYDNGGGRVRTAWRHGGTAPDQYRLLIYYPVPGITGKVYYRVSLAQTAPATRGSFAVLSPDMAISDIWANYKGSLQNDN